MGNGLWVMSYDINSGCTLGHDRGDCTCRVPTMLFWVGTRQCRLLISATNNSHATGNNMSYLLGTPNE